MLEVKQTAQFRRDLKLCAKRRYDLDLITAVVDILRIPAPLPAANKDHPLGGKWINIMDPRIRTTK